MSIFTKLYFVYTIIFNVMQVSFYCKILKPRAFLRRPWQCYALQVILLLPAILLKDTYKAFATCYMSACVLFFTLAFFQNSLSKRLSCFAAWYLTTTAGESLSGFIYSVIYQFTGIELLPLSLTNSDDALLILVSIAIGLFFIFVAYKGAMALLVGRFSYISPLLLLELSLPIILSQMVLSVLYASKTKTQYFFLAVITILLYAGSFLLLQRGMHNLKKQEQTRLKNESYKIYAREQTAQYQSLEKEYRDLRKWNHDTSNHLISLSYLFSQKRYEEAKKYADTLLQKSDGK